MKKLLQDFVNLVYPETCAACGRRLQEQEMVLCLHCEFDLPYSNYHLDEENPVAKQFWGRVPLESAAALYLFSKGSRVQRLIHQLKYKGWQEVGLKLGNIYGPSLLKAEKFAGINYIVPIPLHPSKQKKRGFNQSSLFAQGLAESMNVPWSEMAVIRNTHNSTQTKKGRFDRWRNVERIFTIANPDALRNRHVLLVDDVITTGSTIEACAQEILRLDKTKVSVASIAFAAT